MTLPYQQPSIIDYSHHIIASFKHWTGKDLISLSAQEGPEKIAHNLYHAPIVVLSHGMQADPIFRYANLASQKLWNISWDTFLTLPSRLSAESDAREDRERLLKRAAEHGYVDDYQGIRVTSNGRRFRIQQCILWNVIDDMQQKIGQAATFNQWQWLS